MIESFSRYRDILPVFIEQADYAFAFGKATDTPQRQIELGGQISEFMAFSGGRGKDQFVIVASSELGVACKLPVGTRRQVGKLCFENFGINA